MPKNFFLCFYLLLSGYALPVFASEDPLTQQFQQTEHRLDARLGAVVLDTASGKSWSYRAEERFPMTSTFKAFACGAVLARVDSGQESLGRRIMVEKSDLVTYSPVTEKHVDSGMSLAELCAAAITWSDNTAGNLVLQSLGGPVGFTQFLRSLGDKVSRLDRWETNLNDATPGDPRDTTTPAAAVRNLEALVLGEALSSASRQHLQDWLTGNQVGNALLRAGLPPDWRIGDKTGAGEHGSRSIVAVIWPPQRQPVVAAIYLTETAASLEARNAAVAELGRALALAVRASSAPEE